MLGLWKRAIAQDANRQGNLGCVPDPQRGRHIDFFSANQPNGTKALLVRLRGAGVRAEQDRQGFGWVCFLSDCSPR